PRARSPSGRSFPLLLGISRRTTGCGQYVSLTSFSCNAPGWVSRLALYACHVTRATPRGTFRVEALTRPVQHRHIQVMGERGDRHVGRLLCLRSDPFQSQRDGHRARSPLALSCLGAEMTPGVACAAPGPMDGVGSLASQHRRLLRARLPRLAVPRGVLVRVCHGNRRCPRSYAPLRLPHAPPKFLRVPACPSVPVVPAFWWMDRPGGAAGLSGGALITRWTPPRAHGSALLRDCIDRRLMRLSRVPVLSLYQPDLVYDP